MKFEGFARNRSGSARYLALVLFVFSPVPTLFAFTVYLFSIGLLRCNEHLADLKLYAVLMAAFLGLINSGKVPENDLVWYLEQYRMIENMTFGTYIRSFGINAQGLELAFPVLNYSLFLILGGSEPGYVMLITFLFYFPIFYSLITLAAYNFAPVITVALALTVFALLPNLFSVSAVILRQNIAVSFAMLAMTLALLVDRKYTVLSIIAPFLHSSSILLTAMTFLFAVDFGSRKIKVLVISGLFLMIFTFQYVATLLLPFFQDYGVLGYALARAASGTTYDLGRLSVLNLTYGTVVVCASILAFLRLRATSNEGKNVYYLIAPAFYFCFALINNDQSELSVRFNFYFMSFSIYSVFFIFTAFPKNLVRKFSLLLVPFFWCVFYFDLYNNVWSYGVKLESFYLPVFLYFL